LNLNEINPNGFKERGVIEVFGKKNELLEQVQEAEFNFNNCINTVPLFSNE
jgi:hypothetical protein